MKITDEKYLSFLQSVVSIPTAPFHEQRVIQFIHAFARERGFEVKQDIYGNLILHYSKDPIQPAIGFMAHMDHPGFEVEEVEKKTVWLIPRGGVPNVFIGDSLRLFQAENESLVEITEVITEGSRQDKIARVVARGKKKLDRGGFAIPDLIPFKKEGKIVYSRAIDDLCGCSALISVLDLLHERQPQANVYMVFTRAEETGFLGACAIALGNVLPKNLPIVSLEASKAIPGAVHGNGVVIRIGDRFCIFDSRITGFLTAVANDLKAKGSDFQFQRAVLDGGTCEGSLLYTFGYPSSGLAVPLGCYHNHSEQGTPAPEYIHLGDWYNMVQLIWAVITHTEKLIGWQESGQSYFINRFNLLRDHLYREPLENGV